MRPLRHTEPLERDDGSRERFHFRVGWSGAFGEELTVAWKKSWNNTASPSGTVADGATTQFGGRISHSRHLPVPFTWPPASFSQDSMQPTHAIYMWVVLQGARGCSGIAAALLSLGPVQFLGRISYGVYVVHSGYRTYARNSPARCPECWPVLSFCLRRSLSVGRPGTALSSRLCA